LQLLRGLVVSGIYQYQALLSLWLLEYKWIAHLSLSGYAFGLNWLVHATQYGTRARGLEFESWRACIQLNTGDHSLMNVHHTHSNSLIWSNDGLMSPWPTFLQFGLLFPFTDEKIDLPISFLATKVHPKACCWSKITVKHLLHASIVNCFVRGSI
jgi:hypothetical protein